MLRPWLRQWQQPASLAVSLLVGIAVWAGGLGVGLERALSEVSASLRSHPASGSLHIVEIDARSIAAVDRWPWPRDNYAALVDQLRRAGAASVAFDVDFSARSDPGDDAAFAAALSRLGGKAVLPTFGQEVGGGKEGWIESLPIPTLRDHADLAAVGIMPDGDGAIRRAPLGVITGGVPRPSLSAVLASAGGAVGQDFPIDFAIDPASIPRHSFIDIRDGHFAPAAVAGKDVVIGATAIEMGDRYAVPNHGVIPGVVVQALAAETLLQGKPVELGALPVLLAALAIAWLLLKQRRAKLLAAMIFVAPLLLFGASVGAALFHGVGEIVPGLAVLAYASFCAVSMRVAAATRRRRLHDVQTGLPNRLALHVAGKVSAGSGIIAARFADFDKFAASLGEAAIGDLVRRVHDRIQLVAGDTPIYRPDDRVLAWICPDPDRLGQDFATLRTLMLSPIEVAGRRVDVMLAFGFASGAAKVRSATVLSRAMLAADEALTAGDLWRIHDAAAGEEAVRELSLLSELDEAVHQGEIEVAYQPKLCLKTFRIVSVEALVRWNHGVRGFLPPDLFIPLAERSGRISSLTLHVLEQTIKDLAAWRSRGHEITGAVNLSAKLLNSPSFIADLQQLVAASAVPATMLTFEITESAAMTDTAEAARALRVFQEMGIGISMDDYGTGQSTLSYIKQLPLNELKIDRSFVQFVHQNRSDSVLVQSTVNLAHELGLKVVAEGVEDEACLQHLVSIGCDMAQGYLISRPLPADELAELLGRKRAVAA
jgi:EAL domain-containing protein (putative c-di-GMP-specific phosphodiesterase class I)/CHASE2 domain-containing sensor protein